MILAHDVIEPITADGAGRTIVFLHGILGSRNNWKSFAKKLGLRAVIADLRNHGDSHGFPAPHTIEACADDVRALMRHVGAENDSSVVVGHSFGGKVALLLADDCAQCWVLDAPPSPRSFGGASDVERVIAAVKDVPLPIASRRSAAESLRARGLSEPLAQWMTTNLREIDAGFAWRFDLTAIPEMLASFASADLWPVVDRCGARVHLVRAALSDRWTDPDLALFERAPHHHVVADAGHWLHTDNPAALLALFLEHR